MSEVMQDSVFEIQTKDISNKHFVLDQESRRQASESFAVQEFPTSRDEAWKYTRVAKIRNSKFEIQPCVGLVLNPEKFYIPDLNGSKLIFVNGFFRADLSVLEAESGVSVSAMSDQKHQSWSAEHLGKLASNEDGIFNSMNSKYATDGVAIHISKKTQANSSIQLAFISTGQKTFSGYRNLIVCEDFASAHVVFSSFSLDSGAGFTNSLTEVFVGNNARLKIDKIQNENDSNFHIATEEIRQQKDSSFTINTLTLGGGLVRNMLNIAVEGENSETNLSGAYILKGKQHVDNHTVVDHKVANCVSNELYKGVIDEQATAVFNGKVFVRKDAQKINAFQSNGNVLLSNDASVNSKPELEIYADDVKCSHGSTTGQLDEEAIFYLRARGLSEKSARALMVGAFIGNVLEKVEDQAVRKHIDQILFEKFAWEF